MKSVERSRVTWTRAYAKTKAGTPFGRSRMWRVAITIYCVYCDSVKTEEDKGILEHLVGWSFADRPRSLFAKENTKTIPVRTHLKVYILVLGLVWCLLPLGWCRILLSKIEIPALFIYTYIHTLIFCMTSFLSLVALRKGRMYVSEIVIATAMLQN